MKIKEVMTTQPIVCTPRTNLAEAGALLLDGDCGILPVVDEGRLVGVVTDRDMCIALTTRNARASQLSIGDVMHGAVHTCGPDDDVVAALETMKRHRIRRLPVEGFAGSILGMVSMNDILLSAEPQHAVSDTQIVGTLQTIGAHRHPVPHVAMA
jgi:CBS domain-containing protein